MNAYIEALKAHDWSFEFSDDGRVYRRGLAQRQALVQMQRELDPSGEVWDRYAPEGHRLHTNPGESLATT